MPTLVPKETKVKVEVKGIIIQEEIEEEEVQEIDEEVALIREISIFIIVIVMLSLKGIADEKVIITKMLIMLKRMIRPIKKVIFI